MNREDDAAEVKALRDALLGLEKSRQGKSTHDEADVLREAVIKATLALERKQRRAGSTADVTERAGNQERRQSDVDVSALRTEYEWRSPADHFCALCGCFKSGWADIPNMTAKWCDDLTCPCHEAEPIDTG
jgi:hypothetical protein